MEKIEKICINCPAGCHLEIYVDDTVICVKGFRCPRGREYGTNEITDPRRTVTAAVLVKSGKRCCIPVKSSAPLPVKLIPALLKKLYSMTVGLPIHHGDVIIKNFSGTAIDIIAAGEMLDSDFPSEKNLQLSETELI